MRFEYLLTAKSLDCAPFNSLDDIQKRLDGTAHRSKMSALERWRTCPLIARNGRVVPMLVDPQSPNFGRFVGSSPFGKGAIRNRAPPLVTIEPA